MASKTTNTGIKLTESEITTVNALNEKKEQLTLNINNIAQQKIVLDYRYKQAEKQYEEIVILENQIISSFTQKYGIGTIDIDTGVFIPS